ncbi:MAG: amidase family protein [Anaerolineales bacterium]|jgi:amidase
MENLTMLSVTQAVEAITSRQISSLELVEAVLGQIERHNPSLNAIVTLDADGARQRAKEADAAIAKGEVLGPLHGVPITIKDSFETAEMRTVSGYPPFANHIPQVDAPPVARLRDSGAIILGKTNLPTLANGIQANNPVFGRSNNPWDLARTPGGSSGGAAAAISAGLSYLELGSDISGSIRIPSHFCGIYGLKATGGRISGKGHLASPKPLSIPSGWEPLLQLASMGPMARSVQDLRLCFPLVAEPGTPNLKAQPIRPLSELKIAWTDDFGGAPLDQESRTLIQTLANQLECSGGQVQRCSEAGFDYEEAWFISGACLGAINTLFQPAWVQQIRKLVGPFLARSSQTAIQHGLYKGVGMRPQVIHDLFKKREGVIEALERFLGNWDAWICPVFPTPAFTHRKPNASINVDGQPISMLLANLLHSVIFNVTGHPAVTIPIGTTSQGLPVGVQVIGRRWQEMSLLNTAEQIAMCTPGYQYPLTSSLI